MADKKRVQLPTKADLDATDAKVDSVKTAVDAVNELTAAIKSIIGDRGAGSTETIANALGVDYASTQSVREILSLLHGNVNFSHLGQMVDRQYGNPGFSDSDVIELNLIYQFVGNNMEAIQAACAGVNSGYNYRTSSGSLRDAFNWFLESYVGSLLNGDRGVYGLHDKVGTYYDESTADTLFGWLKKTYDEAAEIYKKLGSHDATLNGISMSVQTDTEGVIDVAKENRTTLAEVKSAVAPTVDGRTVTIKEVFTDQWNAIQQFLQPTYSTVGDIQTTLKEVKAKGEETDAAVDALADKFSGLTKAQVLEIYNALCSYDGYLTRNYYYLAELVDNGYPGKFSTDDWYSLSNFAQAWQASGCTDTSLANLLHLTMLPDIKSDTEELKSDVTSLTNTVNRIEAKIDTLGTKIDALGTKIDTLGTKIDALGTKIDALTEAISAEKARLDNAAAVAKPAASLSSLKSSVGGILDALNGVTDESGEETNTDTGAEE